NVVEFQGSLVHPLLGYPPFADANVSVLIGWQIANQRSQILRLRPEIEAEIKFAVGPPAPSSATPNSFPLRQPEDFSLPQRRINNQKPKMAFPSHSRIYSPVLFGT